MKLLLALVSHLQPTDAIIFDFRNLEGKDINFDIAEAIQSVSQSIAMLLLFLAYV